MQSPKKYRMSWMMALIQVMCVQVDSSLRDGCFSSSNVAFVALSPRTPINQIKWGEEQDFPIRDESRSVSSHNNIHHSIQNLRRVIVANSAREKTILSSEEFDLIPQISEKRSKTNSSVKSKSSTTSIQTRKSTLTNDEKSSKPKTRRATWNDRYQDLCKYKQMHGHCNVPQSQKPLGTWVNTQRIEHARYLLHQKARGNDPVTSENSIPQTSMTPERKAALEEIGFVWDYNGYMWELRYKELLDFKAANNHCCVPRSAGSLGAWVEKQRSEYKKFDAAFSEKEDQEVDGKSSAKEKNITILTKERVQKLNAIGFAWDVREHQFQEMMEELRVFQTLNGHIDPRFMSGKLAFFVRRCEQQYRKYVNTPSNSTEAFGILSESRRRALEDVGFSRDMFDEPRTRSTGHRSSWEERYQELRNFRDANGHCLVPKKYGSLGSWVRAQRHLMKEQGTVGSFEGGVLSEERVDRLNRLGFVWDVHEWQWNRTFHELLDYKMEHNTTNVPMSYGGLGLWVFNQRAYYNSYRKGKPSHMTPARLEKLKSIGFEFDLGRKLLSAADERWQSRLNELKEYREQFGTLRVQKSKNPCLYNWCQNQKASYRAKFKGRHSPLKKEREQALRYLGFLDYIDATS